MALEGVILKPWREWRASDDCTSLSNSTKAMSLRPGTSLTSLNPGNLKTLHKYLSDYHLVGGDVLIEEHGEHHLGRLRG